MPTQLQESMYKAIKAAVSKRPQWPVGHSEDIQSDSQSKSWAVTVKNVRGDGRLYVWFWHKRMGGRRFDSEYLPIAFYNPPGQSWAVDCSFADFVMWHNRTGREIKRRKGDRS